jgi:hypothetical protein
VNNKLNGFGRVIASDGAYFIGNFVNDQLNGYGKNVLANGQVEEGYFKDKMFC